MAAMAWRMKRSIDAFFEAVQILLYFGKMLLQTPPLRSFLPS